jgi:hypothetical protein
MRKSSFLIATAAAALFAGTAWAQGPSGASQQTSPSAGAPSSSGSSGSMSGSGSAAGSSGAMHNGGSTDTGKGHLSGQAGTSGAGSTTGAGATTESNKADDFKTKGASDSNQMQNRKGAQHDKAAPDKQRSGQANSNKSETTGQSQRNDSGTSQSGQSRDMNRSQTQDNTRGEQSGAGTNRSSSSSTNVNVNLSSEQRTRIKEVIVSQKSAPRINNVNFSLSVGTAVPRSVRLASVPTTIIEIEPAWRGYEYFLVGDQIVIVDPHTLHIVAVIEA